MTDARHYDVVVVGGGISGLAMAHLCALDGQSVVVLESAERSGGCVHSHRWESGGRRYWIELGSHTCYNSYGSLLDLLTTLGLSGRLQPREKLPFRMVAGGGLQSLPSQLHWLELLISLPRLVKAEKTGASAEGYYGQILGPRNYRDVLGPALDAVVCQPASKFPADVLFRRKARRKDMPRSFTLQGGLQTLVDTLVQQPGVEVLTGSAVRSVDRDGDTWTVATEAAEYSSPRLVMATPAPVAAGLLQRVEPDLSGSLAQIRVAESEALGVVVAANDMQMERVTGIIGREESFYSALSRDVVQDDKWRGFTFHFRPDGPDERSKLERICNLLGTEVPRLQTVAHKLNRLPSLRAGHLQWLQRMDSRLAGRNLAMVGNYFLGVSLEDCLQRVRQEFSRLQAL